MWNDLLFRLRAVFRRNSVEEELDGELRFHLEREAEKRMALGLARPEALRQARLALGGLDLTKEECRQARGVAALETAVQDLRYALRGMRRSPAFTLAAVLTLGFGAGALSTVFTLANTLFFRELPVARPDRLVAVQPTRRHGHFLGWASYPDYAHFRDGAKTLAGLAAHYSTAPLFVTAGNRSQELNGAVVSANFFPLLGVTPVLGRFFREDEDRVPDGAPVAVLSAATWRNWFGASPDVLGATLKINGTIFTVVGVAPETFRGVMVQPDEIYIPTMMLRVGCRWCQDALAVNCTTLDMIGRLAEGNTIEAARAEMATLAPQSWATAPEGQNTGVTVYPATGAMDINTGRSGQIRFVELLAWVAGVLLLVCCVNLAGLLIARNSARTREFAIRASLGAAAMRLLRQLITESLLLALAGGALGTLLSLVLTGALNSRFYSFDPDGHPLYYNFNPQPRVILSVIAVSMAAGFLAGIIPALKSIRTGAGESLARQSSSLRRAPRWGRWLAGAQAGVAVALAVVAGLLSASAHSIVTGTNYEASHVALLRVRPRLLKYSPEKAQRFVRAVMDRLEAAPGVESASMAARAVLTGSDAQVSLLDVPVPQAISGRYIEIGPRYFATLRTPLLRGREFDRRDTLQSPPVAIVGEALARRFWPAGAAIGATLLVNQRPRQVVGIVKDVPLERRGEPAPSSVFTPYWQNAAQVDAVLLVRVKGDPAAMLPALAREVNRVDPDVPVADTIALPMAMAAVNSDLRITAGFVSYAASLAILLSSVGLYGALAFAVSRRTKEIGIRIAVGAKPSSVRAMVLREGMTVVAMGVALGLALAAAGARVVRHLLYGPGAGDAQVYAAAVLVVASVGLFACWVPARRAASVEPVTALREQ